MSRSSQNYLALKEAEFEKSRNIPSNPKWFEGVLSQIPKTTNTTVKTIDIYNKMEEIQQKSKDETKLEQINKVPVVIGVVAKITNLNSKYGYSWRIELEAPENTSYYLNSKVPGAADKLFKVGQKAAFTAAAKPNKLGKSFLVIQQVFYTF